MKNTVFGMDKKTLYAVAKLIDTICALPTVTKILLADLIIKYFKTQNAIPNATEEERNQALQQVLLNLHGWATEEINLFDIFDATKETFGENMSKDELLGLWHYVKDFADEHDINIVVPDTNSDSEE